jgi:hypothetical protein
MKIQTLSIFVIAMFLISTSAVFGETQSEFENEELVEEIFGGTNFEVDNENEVERNDENTEMEDDISKKHHGGLNRLQTKQLPTLNWLTQLN